MTLIALKCPKCGSEKVRKYGICNGKQRYICKNTECPHITFYTEYTYNACKPGVKAAIRKQSVNGLGIRAIARCLGVDKNTVMAELKKRKPTSATSTKNTSRDIPAVKSVSKWTRVIGTTRTINLVMTGS